jgi:predicted ATPase
VQETAALAQRLGHPHSLAQATIYIAWLHQRRREVLLTQRYAAEVVALCRRYELSALLTPAMFLEAWALAHQGQSRQGIERFQAAFDLQRRRDVNYSRYKVMMIDAYLLAGETEPGLRVVEEGLALVVARDEGAGASELYRLKGELLRLRDGDTADVEACYHQALAVARHQSAKSLELRAAVRLARFWQAQGKIEAARDLLAPIYGWFTEGFDTLDLQEARALLDELV